MRIKTLSVGLGVDVIRADLQRAANDLASIGSKLQPARLGVDAGSSVVATGDQLSRAGDELAARLGSALGNAMGNGGKALQSLAPIADRTAGTIVTGFRRIDAAINFPKAQASLKRIGDALVSVSAVGVFRGVGDEGARVAARVGTSLGKLWDAGPVARFWRDFESRGQAALAKVRARDMVPTGPTVGTGRRIELTGSRVSKQDAIDARAYERAINTVGNLRKALLGVKLAGEVAGIGAKLAATLAADAARVATSPITLMGAAYARVAAVVARLRNALGVFGDVAGKGFGRLFGSPDSLSAPFERATRSARGLSQATRVATGSVGALTGGVKSLGFQIAAAFGAVGIIYKAVQFFKDGVSAASNLNETVSATKQVFGDAFSAIDAQAKLVESRFGIMRKSQLDAASAFGSIAKGAGATEGQAAALASTFTNLAADFASFKNLSFEDAAAKLRSGLAGESEPLRAYGALITEDAVKAKALSMGLGTVAGSARGAGRTFSDLEKIQARASLIMDKLRDSQGDLARTSDSAANVFRRVQGTVAGIGAKIGEAILPAVTSLAKVFIEVANVASSAFDSLRPSIDGAIGFVTRYYETVGMVVRNSGAFWEIAKLKVYEFAINTGRWMLTIPENLRVVGEWVANNWTRYLTDSFTAVTTALGNLGRNFEAFGTAVGHWLANPTGGFKVDFTPLLDGWSTTIDELPTLIKPALFSVQDQVDKIMRGIQEKEAKRVKDIVAPAQQAAAQADVATPAEDMKKKGTPEVKLASAVEASSKEAYSAIVKTQTANDPARDAARVAKEGVGVQKAAVAELKGLRADLRGAGSGAEVFALGTA